MSPLFYAVGASRKATQPLRLQRYNFFLKYARKRDKKYSQLKLRALYKERCFDSNPFDYTSDILYSVNGVLPIPMLVVMMQ